MVCIFLRLYLISTYPSVLGFFYHLRLYHPTFLIFSAELYANSNNLNIFVCCNIIY